MGELACGYGAGGGAVKDFAAKMGVDMTEPEAAKLVRDWRGANPGIVEYWRRLDEALHNTVEHGVSSLVPLQQGYYVRIFSRLAPQSLRVQVQDDWLQSLEIEVINPDLSTLFTRVIHGVHVHGRNIHYWKPSERKTGDLWTNFWVNPKTKQKQAFSVYGGKLSGLLTQSLCRELFFDSLRGVSNAVTMMSATNVQIVGQFHDEIVLDWVPGPLTLNNAMATLEVHMTECRLPGFPLAAEIKHDYRYTK